MNWKQKWSPVFFFRTLVSFPGHQRFSLCRQSHGSGTAGRDESAAAWPGEAELCCCEVSIIVPTRNAAPEQAHLCMKIPCGTRYISANSEANGGSEDKMMTEIQEQGRKKVEEIEHFGNRSRNWIMNEEEFLKMRHFWSADACVASRADYKCAHYRTKETKSQRRISGVRDTRGVAPFTL